MALKHPHLSSLDTRPVLIFVVSDDTFFVSHRMAVGEAALKQGWRVIVAGGAYGGERAVKDAGMEFVALPMAPGIGGFFSNLNMLNTLVRLFRRNPGCIIHPVGTKQILVGNMAARIAGRVKGIVNAVSGLGIAFANPDSGMARMISRALRAVWRRGTGVRTIVQNSDDMNLLLERGIIRKNEIEYIKGSGVDLGRFRYRELSPVLPDGRLRVIFSGRLLKSKGALDFIRAAELLRPEWESKAEFLICGGVHHNADSLTEEDMQRLCDNRYIVWTGHCRNMPELLSSARLIAFPSYYREGIPLALLEASAVGLPIITCDSVGCRDTVDSNGYLVPPREPEILAKRIAELLSDPELCRRMGSRSRELAERDYDLRNVVSRHLSLYSELLKN